MLHFPLGFDGLPFDVSGPSRKIGPVKQHDGVGRRTAAFGSRRDHGRTRPAYVVYAPFTIGKIRRVVITERMIFFLRRLRECGGNTKGVRYDVAEFH